MRNFCKVLWLLLIFHSCTSHPPERQTPYVIARSSVLEQLPLRGLEKNFFGFSQDLFTQIANLEKYKFILITSETLPLVSLLDDGEADAVVSVVEPTDWLRREYLFSQPFFVMGPVLVVKTDSPYTKNKDLMGKTVAYQRELLTESLYTDRYNFNLVPYNTDVTHAVDDLLHGDIDAMIVDSLIAVQLEASLYKNAIRILVPPVKPVGLRLVVQVGKNEELIDKFNEGLEEIKKSGLYDKMLNYWGLFDAQ